jgi:L-ascorbate metabolism protein UlaG (beta-lactamase superfamily)
MAERSWAAALLSRHPPERGLELTWLGQHSFVLRAPGATIAIDPFLSPHPDRLVAPPDFASAFTGLDAVLITHEHLDHLDEDACRAIAEASPGATFVAPRPIVDMVPVDPGRVVGVQPGDGVQLGAAAVAVLPACHAVHVADGYSTGGDEAAGTVRFLGYAVAAGGVCVYHAGDTIPLDGLAERVRELEPDVALLPINGRSPEREAQDIAGNLEPEEAVELAVAAGARVLVPTHYDMFAANLGEPGRAVAYATAKHPALAVLAVGRFEPFVVSGR